MWHCRFWCEKLNSVNNLCPFCFCDMNLVASILVQCGAQVVSVYSMRIPRCPLIRFLICNYEGSRGAPRTSCWNKNDHWVVHRPTCVGWFLISSRDSTWVLLEVKVYPTTWVEILDQLSIVLQWNGFWNFWLPSQHCSSGEYVTVQVGNQFLILWGSFWVPKILHCPSAAGLVSNHG
jgi:hypothetical protein